MLSSNLESWNKFFKNNDVSNIKREIYLSYISKLYENNMPVIFEAKHLSKLAGVSYLELVKAANAPSSYYRSFTIEKRSGGQRRIDSPYPMLMAVQRWILSHVLLKKNASPQSFAYVKDRTIIDNAALHLNKKHLLKIDLVDFFGSIKPERVKNVFLDFGYSESLSYFISQICCLNDCLPQGAPTSPAISNFIASRMDKRLFSISKKLGISYSRYADDLTFSGELIKKDFINIIKKIIDSEGFEINNKKTIFKGHGEKKVVTGICVTGNRLRVPKSFRRDFRKDMYYFRKNGIKEFNGVIRDADPFYVDRLLGRANFILSVEKDNEFALQAKYQLELFLKGR